MLDVTFYANSLFATTMLKNFGIGDNGSEAENVRELVTWNLYLALIGLPGYLLAIFLVDFRYTGRKGTQMLGFSLVAIIYIIIGSAMNRIKGMKEEELCFCSS